ncbi:MAG: divalent-cation tolerance protein CutA [Candidatus Solibacter sp.]
MTESIVVLNTCATEADAERLARALVEARLAACASIVPGLRSFYHWHGAIEESAECLLVIKSSRDLFPALQIAIEKLHSYAVPEILALPVVAGSENYLNWLKSGMRSPLDPPVEVAPPQPEIAE